MRAKHLPSSGRTTGKTIQRIGVCRPSPESVHVAPGEAASPVPQGNAIGVQHRAHVEDRVIAQELAATSEDKVGYGRKEKRTVGG